MYDKPTHDGVEGASPVKPDLVSGLDLASGKRIAWSPQNGLVDRWVLILVEVTNVNLSTVVTQLSCGIRPLPIQCESIATVLGGSRIPTRRGSTPFPSVPPQWPARIETLLRLSGIHEAKRISCTFSFPSSSGSSPNDAGFLEPLTMGAKQPIDGLLGDIVKE